MRAPNGAETGFQRKSPLWGIGPHAFRVQRHQHCEVGLEDMVVQWRDEELRWFVGSGMGGCEFHIRYGSYDMARH